MPLRLLEVYHNDTKELEKILKGVSIIDARHEKIADRQILSRIILPAEETEGVIEKLQKRFSSFDKFRINIIAVEASVPRPEQEEKKEKEKANIEEIYQDLTELAKISKTYIVLVVLASIVASIGLIRNDIAVIIGSMVIAPLLSPNMALSFATTLADSKLAKQAILASIIGYAISFSIGVIFGIFSEINVSSSEISTRVNVNFMYILLALSAGIAGSLSITKNVAQALVGVMVAVALLPPLVTSGLLVGAWYFKEAIGAFILFAVNVVCVNLAGVVTFITQGISPVNWWERKKARKLIWKSVILWLILLLILTAAIIIYK